MSVQTEIDRIISAVGAAYDAVEAKGGTAPQAETIAGLAAAIQAIPSGSAKEEQEKTVTVTANGTVEITPDAGKTLSKATAIVNVPTSGGGGAPWIQGIDVSPMAGPVRLGNKNPKSYVVVSPDSVANQFFESAQNGEDAYALYMELSTEDFAQAIKAKGTALDVTPAATYTIPCPGRYLILFLYNEYGERNAISLDKTLLQNNPLVWPNAVGNSIIDVELSTDGNSIIITDSSSVGIGVLHDQEGILDYVAATEAYYLSVYDYDYEGGSLA